MLRTLRLRSSTSTTPLPALIFPEFRPARRGRSNHLSAGATVRSEGGAMYHSLYRKLYPRILVDGAREICDATSFTRERSKVRSLVRPPRKPFVLLRFSYSLEPAQSAAIGRTKPKLGTMIRGKSVEKSGRMLLVRSLMKGVRFRHWNLLVPAPFQVARNDPSPKASAARSGSMTGNKTPLRHAIMSSPR